MKIPKTFLAILVAMAFVSSLAIIANRKKGEEEPLVSFDNDIKVPFKEVLSAVSTKRVSRFLAQENLRQKSHCNKDNEVCREEGSPGSTCCNNKCIDIKTDTKNCGACKNKCKYTETCCNGECVNVNFDKRHCGKCSSKCMEGGYCIYGMCDYA